MKRQFARTVHTVTNMTYWAENPEFESNNPLSRFVCDRVRSLPFSIHELLKRACFDTSKVLAVNGETVVAANGSSAVDKFMFRYPGRMTLEDFGYMVDREVGTVVHYLAGTALETEVRIKPAEIFRLPGLNINAVAQIQPRLDMDVHDPFKLCDVEEADASAAKDRTVRDLELLLCGIDRLARNEGYYPDVAEGSGNLRRHFADGSVSLIDVMPVYEDGDRLIHDGATILPQILDNIGRYRTFVGQYGA